MDKLLIYWPIEPVLFNGKGIGETWRDEFLRVAPYGLTDDWQQADAAFFYSDSVLAAAGTEILKHVPSVVNHWGFMPKRFLDPSFKSWAQERVSLFNDCIFITTPSLVTQDQLRVMGVESIFLPSGVDTALLNVPTAVEKKLQVLFLSRLAPHKGLDVLIQAMSRLRPPISLVVAGPGDSAPYRQQAESLGVLVSFCEPTDTEKVVLLRESMLLVHPSEYEGFSLPPCEALYCHTPVIVSDIPQHHHLLRNAALYSQSADSLAERIALMLSNYNDAMKLADIGHSLVAENYTLRLASERLSQILHEAIRQHLGATLRAEPGRLLEVYNKDHRRNWAYRGQFMDPEWFRHWRMQYVLRELVGESVLDVGGSCGTYSVGIAQKGYRVTWFDHSEVAREQARSLCEKHGVLDRVDFNIGDVYSLPYGDGAFDTVWAGEILEHVTEPRRVVDECVRVARSKVILSTPIERHHWDPLHLQSFDDAQIAALFEGLKARVEKIAEDGREESSYFVVVTK